MLGMTLTAFSADWPQYLGPDRNGVSSETGLARSWPQGGPRVLWTVKLGPGFGGASVHSGKVYVLDRVEDKNDVLRCLDLNTGKEQWTFAYEAPGAVKFNGSRSVPAVDGKHVFTLGPFGDLHCISKTTHKAVWKKNLMREFQAAKQPWAMGHNPLLYGNLVIVAVQGPKTGLMACDKATGKIVWQTPPLPGRPGYCSPRVVTIDGVDQVVAMSALQAPRRRRRGRKAKPAPVQQAKEVKGGVAAFDANTGEQLWKYGGWQCRIPIPNVTPIGDGRIFMTGGYDAGSAMIKVAKKGERFVVTELYKTEKCNAQIHPAIVYKGHLYANSNSNSAHDGMLCMTPGGDVKWQTGRSPNYERGGLLLADGLIFNADGDKGELRLVEPTPDGYKELASAKLLNTKRAWGPLALSNGRLIIRDQGQMKCLDVRAP